MECSSDQHGRMACTCDGLLLLRRRRRRSDRRPVRSAGGRGRRARRIPHAEPGACPATAADLPETHTPCLSPSNNSKERFDLKNINIVKIKQPTNLYKVSFKGTKLAILGALRCSRPLSTSPSSPRPARHRRQISSMRALDWSMMCRAVCRSRTPSWRWTSSRSSSRPGGSADGLSCPQQVGRRAFCRVQTWWGFLQVLRQWCPLCSCPA